MLGFKKVSKEEFNTYLQRNPNAMSTGCTTICEPPVRHYHDHTIRSEYLRGTAGYFYETEVARVVLDYFGPNGEQGAEIGQYWEYYIKGEE